MRTLIDSAESDRSERRISLEDRELGRYDIQTAALSETRLADVGRSKKLVLDTPSSGADAKVRRGVKQELAFPIKTKLVGKLSGLPKGINDRLMTLRLPLSSKQCNYCQCLCTHDDQSRRG